MDKQYHNSGGNHTETKISAFNLLSEKLFGTGSKQSSVSSHIDRRISNIGRLNGNASNCNAVIHAQRQSNLYNNSTIVMDPLQKVKVKPVKTAGAGWFNLQPLEMDSKLRSEINMVQMRNYMDPKRFYKNPDKITNVLHIGTVIEGPSEYKSSRLTNRERKQTIVDEVLSNQLIKDYTKNKFLDIQRRKANKQKTFRKSKEDRQRAKGAKKHSKLF